MIDDLLHSPVVLWSLAIMLGVPAVLVGLSEIIERMRRRDSAYEPAFAQLRNVWVPVTALALVTTFVFRLPEASAWQRLTITLFLFVTGMTVLGFVASMRVYDKDRDRWEASIPQIAKTVTRVLAVVLPFAMVITAVWELDLSKFITAIGIGSLAIGLALQNTLSSVVSGFLLALDKPFREGDWIEINGVVGEVLDLNWRTTRLMVDGRDIVVIPNTQLLDSQLRNYTVVDEGYRDSISFGFAYKDRPNHVKDVALRVAKESAHVADSPATEVHLVGYGNSSVDYEMHFHCATYISAFQARRVRDDLMTRLFYAAIREGLEIPFPIRTLRQTAEGDLTPDDVRAMVMAVIPDHPVLGQASDAARATLGEGAELRTYGRGTPISEIGAHDSGILLVKSGAVRAEDDNGDPVDHIPEGHLIGARYIVGRRANTLRLVAASDTELLYLPGRSVDRAMDEDAALARALGAYADARLAGLERAAERTGTA